MDITLSIAPELVFNLIVAAVEGGINYWARVDEYNYNDPKYDKNDKPYSAHAKITEMDGDLRMEDWKEHTVDSRPIEKAFRCMAAGHVEFMNEETRARLIGLAFVVPEDADYDAVDADLIIQTGLFGRVVYG